MMLFLNLFLLKLYFNVILPLLLFSTSLHYILRFKINITHDCGTPKSIYPYKSQIYRKSDEILQSGLVYTYIQPNPSTFVVSDDTLDRNVGHRKY